MRPIHWIMLVSLICSCLGDLQAQSCCESDDQVKLCYLSSEDYCPPDDLNCKRYSLDGEFMNEALRLKLTNTDNFGNTDSVPCFFELVNLPINPTLSIIENIGCDVIFLPTVNPGGSTTFISQDIFEPILKWSEACPKNLVIASQGETTKWNYRISSPGSNPNFPENNSSLDHIFTGPFDTIRSFEQGGSYQGYFSKINPGSEIVAKDNADRPTIILDTKTNDLMFADIGIFCSGGGGNISEGESIISNNDILACNIFALACQIASGTVITNRVFEDCDGQIEMPDGSFENRVGVYLHTIPTKVLGCDSIVNTEIIACEKIIVPNIFSPNGDNRNDFFNIITDAEVEVESFKIFNRWGQVVYDNQTPVQGWNGQFENQDAPVGIYIYQIIFNNSIGTRRQIKSGDVTLLR